MKDFILKIPERIFQDRTRRTALATTFAFHVGLLMLMAFVTCSSPTKPEEITEIIWGGSGGSPDVDAPAGPAQRGNPNIRPKPVPAEPPRTDPKNIETPKTVSPSEEMIPSQKKEEKPKPPTPSRPSDDAPKAPTNSEQQGGQRPDGTGRTPAGGSGGSSVGYSVSGLGNRGWISAPGKPNNWEAANASGTVVLKFSVMPNGDITNITPIKRPNAVLVAAAISALRRARARPLPSGVPQIPQSGQISYNFVLN